MENEYSINITWKADTNTVGFECHGPNNMFPIGLLQMILAEAGRQLDCQRRAVESFAGMLDYPGDFKLEIYCDAETKKVTLDTVKMIEIPIAQMAIDEVIRLVQEQRNFANIKITQQRLQEEQMMASLTRSVHA